MSLTASTPFEFSPDSVGSYLVRWLAHERGRVRVVTYEGYEVLLRRHVPRQLCELGLQELRPLHIQDLYGRLLAPADGSGALSGGTVLNLHLVLTQAFGQAVRWQLLTASPLAGTQPPRPRRPARIVVDPVLLGRLLTEVSGTWLELPATVAAATGMRRGEILGVRWTDLDEARTVVRVQRTLQPTRDGLVFEEPRCSLSLPLIARSMDSKST